MRLRVCPVCSDFVAPSSGRCVRGCVWPPHDASLGRGGAPGNNSRPWSDPTARNWLTSCSNNALQSTATNLRRILQDIDRELEARRSMEASIARSTPEIQTLLVELAPSRFPRLAARCSDIEQLAVAACGQTWAGVKALLAENGFMRVRRAVQGRNVYVYKYRFRSGEQPSFVCLGVGGE